jgi:hypothetical protein
MPAGLQVQTWFKQNIAGTANEALAPGTGDSATFFNVPQGSQAYLGEVWGIDNASPCDISLVASRFHDQQSGVVYKIPDGATLAPAERPTLCSSPGIDQPIFPSDVLTVQVDGTAADDVNVTLVIYYADIPGINARLASYGAIMAGAGNQVGIRSTLTAGTGNWGSSVALNASDNRLHANRDYAVLGFTAEAPLAAVGIQGVDLGNLRAGGPVLADGGHDGSLFLDFARAYNAALVPVINSNNAGATLLQAAHTDADTVPITVNLVELPQGYVGG